MADERLSLAISRYAHTADLVSGAVRPQGTDLVCTVLDVEEIFHRFVSFREWDVSEMSLAKYCSLVSQGDTSLTAIPVFPSRLFRHSGIYVRAGAGISTPADLVGRRVGLPEWTQTAGVYVRGLLQHEYGVALDSVEWFQAGVNTPGREEHVPPVLPDGIKLTSVHDRSLDQLLKDGDLDAAICARAPNSFLHREGHIERLFPDSRAEEKAYFQRTGIYPIMHVMALKAESFTGRRWLIGNLFTAFCEAKEHTLARLRDGVASYLPLPWALSEVDEARALFGEDHFPYGIDANRTTLDAFLGYAFEQGVLRRPVPVEELFAPEVRNLFRV